MKCTRALLVALTFSSVGLLAAQQQAEKPKGPAGLSSRKTTAVTYEARRTSKVDLIGTPLMPRARGEAEIKTESSGPVRIKAKVQDLTAPMQFGAEYLTYVAWTIPPKGRAKNLGEVRLDEGKGEIEATSDAQTFSLMVTAEPYYAVTTPSDVVVLENAIRRDTRGDTSMATLEYEIVPRGAYTAAVGRSYRLAAPAAKNEPPDVSQARNAVALARLAEADRLAGQSFGTAERLLGDTEQLVKSKGDKREIISQARAAVQAAEEARLQAGVRRIADAEEAERAAAAAREQAARDKAAQEAAARAAADERRKAAEQERLTAEKAAQDAAVERQRAEEAQRTAESARAEAEKAKLEAEQARAEAETARSQAESARSQAQAEAARAEELRAKAEQDKAQLRAQLLKQFNDILETRDTARGLVVNVGDVLFETGRYELKPAAREKLARFSGIVLAHPGLAVQAEGFTDSTGTTEINEKLSQQRADAVGQYLVAQGVAADRVTTRGYGSSQPVAPNDTREGRQKNRRVELVVAGEVIGTPISDAKR